MNFLFGFLIGMFVGISLFYFELKKIKNEIAISKKELIDSEEKYTNELAIIKEEQAILKERIITEDDIIKVMDVNINKNKLLN